MGAELPASESRTHHAKGLGGVAATQRSFSFGALDQEKKLGPEDVVVESLVARVLRELCTPPIQQQQQQDVGFGSAGPESTWVNEMAEGRRRVLFRTQYRVVESEVVGLGVKW
jgi:hypothetical protein